MLDERSNDLLKIINSKCAEGSFNVLEISELIAEMPRKFKADAELIKKIVPSLSAEGYIEIKYEDEEKICVMPTVRGRSFFEERLAVNGEKRSLSDTLKQSAALFAAVFLGIVSAFYLLALTGVIK